MVNVTRQFDELRPVSFEIGYTAYAEGSVLVSMGDTKVLCNASIEESVPPWMLNEEQERGWVTGEYSMLPRSTHTRSRRETHGPKGRTQEIQRLIGRSLRAAVNLNHLGRRTIIVDCDVLQADGGTRTASITGGYVALQLALKNLADSDLVDKKVHLSPVAAISAGIINGEPQLDLCYEMDVAAEVDANFVMNGDQQIIEVQGTAEGSPFSRAEYDQLMDLAQAGIRRLIELQHEALEKA